MRGDVGDDGEGGCRVVPVNEKQRKVNPRKSGRRDRWEDELVCVSPNRIRTIFGILVFTVFRVILLVKVEQDSSDVLIRTREEAERSQYTCAST